MRQYETMFIVRPELTEDEAGKVLEEVQSLIKSKGEVTGVDRWGKRRFAYEIDHLTEGYYFVVNFNSEPSAIAEMDRRIKLNNNIVRHIIVRTDES